MREHDTNRPRRVLITGGSGFIGRALTAELAAAGYDVVVLSRSPQRVSGLPPGARAAGWDAETADGWGELADGAYGIVHLAGENLASGPWTSARKKRIRDSRVESSRAVLAALGGAAVRPQVLVQASGVDYYGARGAEVVREEEPPGEGFLAEVCVRWEAATAPAEDLGVRRAVARSGVVLDTGGGALPKMALPFKLFVGGPLGSGRQYLSWIHRADEVAALRFLLESPEAAGAFNLTAPEPVTNREFSAEIARHLGRPNLLGAPGFALHLALGDMADMLLHGQRAVPAALERLGFRFRFRDLRAALADALG
jgi:uncharacterized protein